MPEPEPLSTPKLLLDWLAAMRDAGDLAPMLVAIRGGAVVASGFVDPPYWPPYVALAFYGFDAEVLALAMDSWSYIGSPPAGATPEERFAAGDPNAYEAICVQWVPRVGPARIVERRYRDTGDAIDWLNADDLHDVGFLGQAHVPVDDVRDALDQAAPRCGPGDPFICAGSQTDRDRLTARYLGLDLR